MLPAWRRSEINAVVSGSPFGFGQIETDEQFSAEARLAGRTGPIEWLAGGFLFDDDIRFINPTNLSSSLSFADQNYATRSRAIFGNAMFHLTPRLRLRWRHPFYQGP